MMTLMRRAGGFSSDEQLELLYNHMRQSYKIYVRRDDVCNIPDLIDRAGEFEDIEQGKIEEKKRDQETIAPAIAAMYNRNECCWKCKQCGHTRFQCKRPAKKFCSQCGKDGVLTKECHPLPGKEKGAGPTAALTALSPA